MGKEIGDQTERGNGMIPEESVDQRSEKGRHFRFSEFFSPNNPRGTLVLLGIVTLVILFVGWFYLAHTEPIPPKPKLDFPVTTEPTDLLHFVFTDLKESGGLDITAGQDNEFYVAYPDRVTCYRIDEKGFDEIQVTKEWDFPTSAPPTSIHYVRSYASSLWGKIFIAYPDRVEWVDSLLRENGATPFFPLGEGSKISGIVSDEKSIFFADIGKKIVDQVEFTGKLVREIGAPDPERRFDGFQLKDSPFFALDIYPGTNILYVTNPGLFRVEAFSTLTGEWLPVESWENSPEKREGFSGDYNPAAIISIANQSFLTVERGSNPRIKNIDAIGDVIADLSDSLDLEPLPEGEIYRLAIVTSSATEQNRLLVLFPSGRLACFTP